MKVVVALLAFVATASGAKPVVNSHSVEEGQAMAQDLLNDAMNRMGKTAEGAKKMAADPSMFIRAQHKDRKLTEAAPRGERVGKTSMHAYTREQGRIKGEQVIAERKARKANLRQQ